MKVVVTSEFHYVRAHGTLYTSGMCDYEYWRRLLGVFDEVVVFAREHAGPVPVDARAVEGPGVSVIAARDFVATRGLLGAVPSVARCAWKAAAAGDAFILHAPGIMATALREALRSRRHRYGIEVVGDPRQALRGAGRALTALRWVGAAVMREQVRDASASRFVTRQFLQRRYPPRAGTPTVVASDVSIPDELFDLPPREVRRAGPLALGFVGALQRPYKGVDVLLDALARTTLPHRLGIVGDGILRPALEAQATRLGVSDRVTFHGALPPGRPIFDFMSSQDLLVQPSRTEGLPRVLLEAMAVGLPCLGTPVGGVPELLEPAEMVPANDPGRLAAAIDEMAADRPRRTRVAAANRERARPYRASESARRLRAFYENVRDATRTGSRSS
ncbi:MAG: glycosyltransferase [Kofleriaceae bacterium]|nr:glycosyltransferase [Kofleriaceae bacterium]